MSCLASSSSNSSSSTEASWYCWYSLTRSFMLESDSVNSISSMPSPVYQWRKALRLNMTVNCSPILLNKSWMAVELPIKVAAIFKPLGGMSHTAVLVVGDPLDKVGAVLVLHTKHLLVHLLHRHPATEHSGHGEVPAVGVAGGHHVL